MFYGRHLRPMQKSWVNSGEYYPLSADLLEFSKSIPITDIPNHIDRGKQEKKKLEEVIAILQERIRLVIK